MPKSPKELWKAAPYPDEVHVVLRYDARSLTARTWCGRDVDLKSEAAGLTTRWADYGPPDGWPLMMCADCLPRVGDEIGVGPQVGLELYHPEEGAKNPATVVDIHGLRG